MNRLVKYIIFALSVVIHNGIIQSATQARQFAQDSYCVQEFQKQIHALSLAKPEDAIRIREDIKKLFVMCANGKDTEYVDSVALAKTAALHDNALNKQIIEAYVRMNVELMSKQAESVLNAKAKACVLTAISNGNEKNIIACQQNVHQAQEDLIHAMQMEQRDFIKSLYEKYAEQQKDRTNAE